jgi:adenylate cyclase
MSPQRSAVPVRSMPASDRRRMPWAISRRRLGEAALAALILLLSSAAALLLVRPPSPLAAADRLFQAVAFRLAAPPPSGPPRVVILGITETTLAGFPYASPIDRGFLADLVDRMTADGAAAVGLDVLLDRATEPGKDAALARALRRGDIPVAAISVAPETGLPPERRQFLEAYLQGVRAGDANLSRDRFDDIVRTHRPRHPATGQPSFPASIAAALGAAVPRSPFTIAWRPAGDAAVPVYPAETAALLPRDWIAGKAVLIGSLVPGSDEHRTLASAFGPPSFGVEIHAQVLSQLLEGRAAAAAVSPWRDAATAAGLAAAAMLVAFLLAGTAVAAAMTLLIAGFLAMAMAAYAAGGPLPGLAPALAAGLAGGAVRAWRGYCERRDRRALRFLFSRFLSEPVVKEILSARDLFLAGGRPRPQELTATVLFSDVAGFTTICESLPPEPLIAWLDRYIDTMVKIVIDHNGVVLRFVGDGILTVFGVPVPRRDPAAIAQDACNAARCAQAMEQAMRGLNAGWRAEGLPEAGLRIGLHTGPLVAGSLGRGPRLEFCLLGDTANVGARLEQLGKEHGGSGPGSCTIMVGGPTWACLGGAFAGRWVGEMALRGKHERLAVWRIDAAAAVATAPPPQGSPALPDQGW